MWNSQSTIYLKSHGCVHSLQSEMSLINFRRCFVSRVRYPEIGHFEMQNRLDTYLFDSQNTVSGTLFFVSGWRRRVWKTVLFRVSHLFSVFWLSFVAALSEQKDKLDYKYICKNIDESNKICFTGKTAVQRGTGAELRMEWEKMSKSKHNGVDPQVSLNTMAWILRSV